MPNSSDLSLDDYKLDPNDLERLKRSLQDSSTDYSPDDIFIDPTITSITPEQIESLDVSRGFQPPIKGDWKVSGTFSLSPTDPRHPKGHMGVDMRAPAGTPIYPLAPGIVTNIGSSSVGGLTVNIDHDNGVKSYYAHCSTIKVQKGDKVGYNTQIATVGDTGNAKGTFPHLHFQVSKDGQTQNPNQYFSVPAYTNLGKDEKFWLSEEAKLEAKNFDLKKHISSKSAVAFSQRVEEIRKMANSYYRLTKKL